MQDKQLPQLGATAAITITGRIVEVGLDGDDFPYAKVVYGDLNHAVTLDVTSGVEVAYIEPAQGPVLAGDLWTDAYGDPWLAFDSTDYDDEPPYQVMMTHGGQARPASDIIRDRGPLVLAYRAPKRETGELS